MARTKASNQAQYKYNAAHLKRVPLDLQLSEYDLLKQAALSAGQSVNGYIKQAIAERIKRDNVLPVGDLSATPGNGAGAGGYAGGVGAGVSAENTANIKNSLLDILE